MTPGISSAAKEGPITEPKLASLPCLPPIVTWYHSEPSLSTPNTPIWPI